MPKKVNDKFKEYAELFARYLPTRELRAKAEMLGTAYGELKAELIREPRGRDPKPFW